MCVEVKKASHPKGAALPNQSSDDRATNAAASHASHSSSSLQPAAARKAEAEADDDKRTSELSLTACFFFKTRPDQMSIQARRTVVNKAWGVTDGGLWALVLGHDSQERDIGRKSREGACAAAAHVHTNGSLCGDLSFSYMFALVWFFPRGGFCFPFSPLAGWYPSNPTSPFFAAVSSLPGLYTHTSDAHPTPHIHTINEPQRPIPASLPLAPESRIQYYSFPEPSK